MAGIIGPTKSVSTTQNLVAAYLSNLRHLSVPEIAKQHLQNVHKYQGSDQDERANALAGYIRQALEFRKGSMTAPPAVKPVMQYYCYLNLATAATLCYGAFGVQQKVRHHGAKDCTADLATLDLDSPVVRVTSGALTQFHSIISNVSIENSVHPLRTLFGSIPLVEHELLTAFGIRQYTVAVRTVFTQRGDQNGPHYSSIQLRQASVGLSAEERERLLGRFEALFTDQMFDYDRVEAKHSPALSLRFDSKKTWPNEEKADGFDMHRQVCRQFVNWGGHNPAGFLGGAGDYYAWRTIETGPILPTLTASLLAAFSMASICRYRPWLLNQLETSRYYLLWDTFINEADSFIIPSLRNLICAEELVMTKYGTL